jgi:hypothetical protein
MNCLSPAQRAEFQRARWFTVQGKSGTVIQDHLRHGRQYRGADALGTVDYRLCAGPVAVPLPGAL